MKKTSLFLLAFLSFACDSSAEYKPQNGDITFQTSLSSQSAAIQAATKSRYSHVGIVYVDDGVPYVYEAVGPVRATPLNNWIQRGEGARFVVKRLRDAKSLLTEKAIAKMQSVGKGEGCQALTFDITV